VPLLMMMTTTWSTMEGTGTDREALTFMAMGLARNRQTAQLRSSIEGEVIDRARLFRQLLHLIRRLRLRASVSAEVVTARMQVLDPADETHSSYVMSLILELWQRLPRRNLECRTLSWSRQAARTRAGAELHLTQCRMTASLKCQSRPFGRIESTAGGTV
jgi:hypothetical protein